MIDQTPPSPQKIVRAPKSLIVFQVVLWSSLLLLVAIYVLPGLMSGEQKHEPTVSPPASSTAQP